MTQLRGMTEPPEGALVGESVPRENEEDEQDERQLLEMANEMKGLDRFKGYGTEEIVEYLREKRD